MEHLITTITTDRLILRPLTQADAEAVFCWVSDKRVTRFMPYNTYTEVEDVRKWLQSVEQDAEDHNFGFVRRSDGLLIGSGNISYDKGSASWEFGYNFRYDCWGQGYATEAAKAMIAFARDNFGAKIFTANHAIENPASGRVMEKCGLIFDHLGEYNSFDGKRTFPAKFYRMELPAFQLVPNQPDRAITIMHEVAAWGRSQGFRIWPDEWLTLEALLTEDNRPEDFYIGKLGSEEVCCAIIQWMDREWWPQVPHGEAAYIHKLCVRRKYAGQGIPALLVKFLTEECKKHGAKFIRLDTGWDEEKVKACYLALGFSIVKKVELPNGRAMALYEKEVK